MDVPVDVFGGSVKDGKRSVCCAFVFVVHCWWSKMHSVKLYTCILLKESNEVEPVFFYNVWYIKKAW